jgi:hypothetical protein
MNQSILIAIALLASSAPGIVAGPNVIDHPGPGYRLQKELFSPQEGRWRSHLEITPSLFLQKTFLNPGPLRSDKPVESTIPFPNGNPFAEPIRLFQSPN